MRFVNRINEKTGCCIGAADIFSSTTMELRELAAMIETDQENGAAGREIPPAPKADDYPAALAQRRIFLRQNPGKDDVGILLIEPIYKVRIVHRGCNIHLFLAEFIHGKKGDALFLVLNLHGFYLPFVDEAKKRAVIHFGNARLQNLWEN